ncbi:hypothetical protein LDENG_00229340, partial [Lucifuga dentata]
MTGCCITDRHGLTQINYQRNNKLTTTITFIHTTSKQEKCHTTHTIRIQPGFPTDSSHIKIHQIYQSCSSSEDKVH